MKRRKFLQVAGAGLAASAIAKPAIAQSMPELKWRLPMSWPKSLDTLYGGGEADALPARGDLGARDDAVEQWVEQVQDESTLGTQVGPQGRQGLPLGRLGGRAVRGLELVRRQLEANGLKPEQAEIDDEALRNIIRGYTREAGVRNLEREIGAICRKVAVSVGPFMAAPDSFTIEHLEAAGKDPAAQEQAVRDGNKGAIQILAPGEE